MSTLNIKEALEAKEKEYNMSEDIFGMTALTNPAYTSASRNIINKCDLV